MRALFGGGLFEVVQVVIDSYDATVEKIFRIEIDQYAGRFSNQTQCGQKPGADEVNPGRLAAELNHNEVFDEQIGLHAGIGTFFGFMEKHQPPDRRGLEPVIFEPPA
jgi:hypothetical protein